MKVDELEFLWRLWGKAWRKRLDMQAARSTAIANPSDSKNTGFRPLERQGGRQ